MKTSASDAHLSQHSGAPSPSPPDPNSRVSAANSAASAAASLSASAPAPRRAASKKSPLAKPEVAASDEAPRAGEEAKKRVRLKPETREQLLERLRNPPLSLHETSILLRVSRATVRRYADAGRLPCLRTPGGQRRFALRDIEAFYRQLKTRK